MTRYSDVTMSAGTRSDRGTRNDPSATPVDHWCIRVYRPEDHPAVLRLYTEGLLHGQIDPGDTAADIDHIQEAYFTNPRDRFWVAAVKDQVHGMIGVLQDEPHTAHVRRLRVDRNWQNTPIAQLLLETALTHCRHVGALKVVLDTPFEAATALPLFHRLGFLHTRTRRLRGRDYLEFYMDLYRAKKENTGG